MLVASFFSAIGLLLMFGYWTLVDTKPPYMPVSVKVMDANGNEARKFKRGETMLVERENCGLREEQLYFSRKFVCEDVTYNVGSGGYLVELGCRKTINAVTIPTYIKPGRCTYSVSTTYDNNWLHSGKIVLPTFEIVAE